MLNPSGETPSGTTSAPSSHSTVGRDLVGGAVGAIDHDPSARRAAGRAGSVLDKLDIAAGGVVQPLGAAERVGGGSAVRQIGAISASISASISSDSL